MALLVIGHSIKAGLFQSGNNQLHCF